MKQQESSQTYTTQTNKQTKEKEKKITRRATENEKKLWKKKDKRIIPRKQKNQRNEIHLYKSSRLQKRKAIRWRTHNFVHGISISIDLLPVFVIFSNGLLVIEFVRINLKLRMFQFFVCKNRRDTTKTKYDNKTQPPKKELKNIFARLKVERKKKTVTKQDREA